MSYDQPCVHGVFHLSVVDKCSLSDQIYMQVFKIRLDVSNLGQDLFSAFEKSFEVLITLS